eukprot:1398481-Prymnesium_polylepis.2
MQRSTTIKVEHLCCGMESKLIRDVLAPLEAVADVKISLTDRRIKVEHDSGLAPETIVNMLNQKRLGASLQDRSVVEGVAGSFNHAEMVRLTVNVTQISLFVATLVLMCAAIGRRSESAPRSALEPPLRESRPHTPRARRDLYPAWQVVRLSAHSVRHGLGVQRAELRALPRGVPRAAAVEPQRRAHDGDRDG